MTHHVQKIVELWGVTNPAKASTPEEQQRIAANRQQAHWLYHSLGPSDQEQCPQELQSYARQHKIHEPLTL